MGFQGLPRLCQLTGLGNDDGRGRFVDQKSVPCGGGVLAFALERSEGSESLLSKIPARGPRVEGTILLLQANGLNQIEEALLGVALQGRCCDGQVLAAQSADRAAHPQFAGFQIPTAVAGSDVGVWIHI